MNKRITAPQYDHKWIKKWTFENWLVKHGQTSMISNQFDVYQIATHTFEGLTKISSFVSWKKVKDDLGDMILFPGRGNRDCFKQEHCCKRSELVKNCNSLHRNMSWYLETWNLWSRKILKRGWSSSLTLPVWINLGISVDCMDELFKADKQRNFAFEKSWFFGDGTKTRHLLPNVSWSVQEIVLGT